MTNGNVTVGIVVGVVTGIVAANIGVRAALQAEGIISQDELEDAKKAAHRAGWKMASNDANNVRARYIEMFGDPDED